MKHYYINLERRPERNQNMIDLFAKLEITDYERIEEVDGNLVDYSKVLSNGIIINERSIKEMSGPFANYHKQFSVAYKSQIYACEVEQNDLKVKSFCIRTQFD